jgi:hypothetical protein
MKTEVWKVFSLHCNGADTYVILWIIRFNWISTIKSVQNNKLDLQIPQIMFLHIVFLKSHIISKPRIWSPEVFWGYKLCKKNPITRQSRIKTVCITGIKSLLKNTTVSWILSSLRCTYTTTVYVSTNVFTMCLGNLHFFTLHWCYHSFELLNAL